MNIKQMITCGFSAMLCIAATTSHATWDRDDTASFWTHLKEIRDGTGGRTTLEPQTYYVRGQILTKQGQGDSIGSGTSAGRYFLAPPTSGPLKIIGAPGVKNSTELTA